MALSDDLQSAVNGILQSPWNIGLARQVPETDHVQLTGGGRELEGTVLYSDLAQSSVLATEFQRRTAAKVIKCFLLCCSRLITTHRGKVTSFDGDRVMGIFIGDSKNTNAAKAELKIKYSVDEIIKPMVEKQFASIAGSRYEISHAVGVDTGNLFAVRAGQRGANDLIWIGRAPNFAADLSTIRLSRYNTFISIDVYNTLHESAKMGDDGRNMWERMNRTWLGRNWIIYRSSYHWKP